MKTWLFLVLLSSQLVACGGSSSSSDNKDAGDQNRDQQTSCTGFNSPQISVSVLDSHNNESLNTARVDVTYNDSTAASTEATYEGQAEAYIGSLSNEEYKSLTVVVSANNYQTHVSKHQALIEDTRCDAKNTLELIVYLCATGTACI